MAEICFLLRSGYITTFCIFVMLKQTDDIIIKRWYVLRGAYTIKCIGYCGGFFFVWIFKIYIEKYENIEYQVRH